MITELAPGEAVPDDVHTIFFGLEGETADTTRPEDTWSTRPNQPNDGLHIYETPTYRYTEDLEQVVIMNRVRPIVTRRYIEAANARAVAKGLDPIYITWAEVPAFKPRASLFSKALGRLGLAEPKGPWST